MRMIFLLLGIAISFKGFAGPPQKIKPTDMFFIETQWTSHLNNKANWRERQDAVKDWKTVAQFNPKTVVFYLRSTLSDRSQKVRETTVTALKEMAEKGALALPQF